MYTRAPQTSQCAGDLEHEHEKSRLLLRNGNSERPSLKAKLLQIFSVISVGLRRSTRSISTIHAWNTMRYHSTWSSRSQRSWRPLNDHLYVHRPSASTARWHKTLLVRFGCSLRRCWCVNALLPSPCISSSRHGRTDTNRHTHIHIHSDMHKRRETSSQSILAIDDISQKTIREAS